ncbi:transcription initiation factor TFIID subunit A, partial [Opisthorchis viverrini]
MKAQTNPTVVPSGSLLIQPGQAMSVQPGTITNLQPGVPAPMSHQGLHVWAPAPGGTINMSGLGAAPRGHPGMVTLPSGQTVLMTNLVTTASTPPMPLPVSSPMSKPPLQAPPVGNPMILSGSTQQPIAVPMTTHHLTSTVIQGPNGPISVALPNSLLPTSSMNHPLGTGAPSYVSTAHGQTSSDPSVQGSQFIEPVQTNYSFPTPGYQTVIPSGQVVLDQSGINLQPPNSSQPNSVSTSIAPVSSPSPTNQLPVTSHSGIGESSVVYLSPVNRAPSTIAQQTVASTVATQPSTMVLSLPQSNTNDCKTITLSNSTEPTLPTQSTKDEVAASGTAVFTPASLTQLISDLDPQLQLDSEAYEVLVNLANEFIVSVASKAQKLASHRGSSNVDAKDIHFCLERDWDISIPGNLSEDRPLRQNSVVEAHRQRLALIKKQIRKM